MDNALENENLGNQGQVNDNVGQDENQTQDGESKNDWEATAKYMQSEKDKLQSENQKLKDYEKVGITTRYCTNNIRNGSKWSTSTSRKSCFRER